MTKQDQEFKVGDLVQCQFRKRWYGVVIGVRDSLSTPSKNAKLENKKNRKTKNNKIYEVQPTETVDGRPQPKHIKPRIYSGYWLIKDSRSK